MDTLPCVESHPFSTSKMPTRACPQPWPRWSEDAQWLLNVLSRVGQAFFRFATGVEGRRHALWTSPPGTSPSPHPHDKLQRPTCTRVRVSSLEPERTDIGVFDIEPHPHRPFGKGTVPVSLTSKGRRGRGRRVDAAQHPGRPGYRRRPRNDPGCSPPGGVCRPAQSRCRGWRFGVHGGCGPGD